MTSEEIKEKNVMSLGVDAWLKEVAYQLALLNEKGVTPAITTEVAPERVKRAYNRKA